MVILLAKRHRWQGTTVWRCSDAADAIVRVNDLIANQHAMQIRLTTHHWSLKLVLI